MRIDRPQISSCQVVDNIKVDLAVSEWKKIKDKDKCAKIGGIFLGEKTLERKESYTYCKILRR